LKKTLYADTNIIVRLLTNDDAGQSEIIAKLFEEDKISLIVPSAIAIETCWVLKSYYKFKRPDVAAALLAFFKHVDIHAEEDIISEALEVYQIQNVDIADIYLSLKSGFANIPILTWDNHFSRLDAEWYSPDRL
jgi:predicted nucleic-acid-binding protein